MARVVLAIIIVIVSLVGVVATAYSFYRPAANNAQPCVRSTFSPVYDVTNPINGKYYQAVKANFTTVDQNFVFGSVTFLVVEFNDPSLPHLDNGQCVASTDKTSPATIKIQLTFATDGSTEPLTMTFKGTQTQQQAFSTHSHPTAGILWYPGDAHIVLIVSKN